MSLRDRVRSTSTIKETAILNKSIFLNDKNFTPLQIPALNIISSGDIDGGFSCGLTMWCGPSKHFKTMFSLLHVKAYLDKYPEAICLLYDSEFGAPLKYFDMLNIDKERVVHSPIVDVEQLKFDILAQLDAAERGDKLIICIDSMGMLASKKEVEDARSQNSAADMSRAKAFKSLFRIVTPRLTLKDIPLIVVNHTYKEIGLYPKDIVGGGTGSYLGSDNIYILGRQQEKDGKDLTGYNFVINVEKSRFVREKSKIIVEVNFETGISKWSGLLDIALESGHVTKPAKGWYQKTGFDAKYRESDTNTEDFWSSIISDPTFKKYIKDHYQLGEASDLIQ